MSPPSDAPSQAAGENFVGVGILELAGVKISATFTPLLEIFKESAENLLVTEIVQSSARLRVAICEVVSNPKC